MPAFDFNKVRSPRFLWTHTGVGKANRSPPVTIAVEWLEEQVSIGRTRKEMARDLGISYVYFNRRVNESFSLSEAFQKGLAKLKTTI